jgi:hypothetical protein
MFGRWGTAPAANESAQLDSTAVFGVGWSRSSSANPVRSLSSGVKSYG